MHCEARERATKGPPASEPCVAALRPACPAWQEQESLQKETGRSQERWNLWHLSAHSARLARMRVCSGGTAAGSWPSCWGTRTGSWLLLRLAGHSCCLLTAHGLHAGARIQGVQQLDPGHAAGAPGSAADRLPRGPVLGRQVHDDGQGQLWARPNTQGRHQLALRRQLQCYAGTLLPRQKPCASPCALQCSCMLIGPQPQTLPR